MQDEMVKFAKCMREQGIDMPDPAPAGAAGGEGSITVPLGKGGLKPHDPKMKAAHEACKQFFGASADTVESGGQP
jgi:hypothetical protein